MSLSDLASIGSFISGIAVLVSLVYLSLQIRQNTKHSQALIQQGRAARIADIASRIVELRADDGLNGCFDGSPEASAKDVSRFLSMARAFFISAEDSFLQIEDAAADHSGSMVERYCSDCARARAQGLCLNEPIQTKWRNSRQN